jgi:hypothetical protein
MNILGCYSWFLRSSEDQIQRNTCRVCNEARCSTTGVVINAGLFFIYVEQCLKLCTKIGD